MNTNHDNLDKLKGKNPFSVPKGYMEGLNERIMNQLPEKDPIQEVPVVTLKEKLRPLLYLAAMITGMMLFFKVFVGSPEKDSIENPSDSLLVQTEVNTKTITDSAINKEDEEYLEYVEDLYAGYLLKEEVAFSE